VFGSGTSVLNTCGDRSGSRLLRGSSTVAIVAVVFSSFLELVDALLPSSVEFEPCGECSPAAVLVLSALAVPVVAASSLI